MRLFISDEGADRAVCGHYLKRRNEAAVHRWQELLTNHGVKHHRELHAYLVLLIYREHINDTVDRIRGAERMQSRKHELTVSAAVIATLMVS